MSPNKVTTPVSKEAPFEEMGGTYKRENHVFVLGMVDVAHKTDRSTYFNYVLINLSDGTPYNIPATDMIGAFGGQEKFFHRVYKVIIDKE